MKNIARLLLLYMVLAVTSTEGQVDSTEPTSSKCKWSDWSDWSACSTSCGSGQKFRSRHVLHTEGKCFGDSESEQVDCDLPECAEATTTDTMDTTTETASPPREDTSDPRPVDYQIPIIDKCCPRNQVFDVEREKCVDLEAETDVEENPITPPLSGEVFNSDSIGDIVLIGNASYPQCDMETETLQYRLYQGDDPSESSFLIDDYGGGYDLIDLWDIDVMDNYIRHTSYCLETGYNSSEFVGTVALVCKSRVIMCEDPRSIILLDDDNGSQEQENITLIEFIPNCDHVFVLEEFTLDPQKGTATAHGTEYLFGEFCLHGNATTIDVCPPDGSKGFLKWDNSVNRTLLPILFGISLLFLGILFCHVYIKNRQKLFGAMTLCLVSMFGLLYAKLIIMSQIPGEWLKDHDDFCVCSALFTQFIVLSAMFWLNIISFDVWTTFRRFQVRQNSVATSQSGWRNKKFKWYALYSWGCPLIITVVTAIMHLLPKEVTENAYVPNFGNRRSDSSSASQCYLEHGWSTFFYMGIIVIPLLCCNILLYLNVAWNLCFGIWAETKTMKNSNRRYNTVIKMFFAMGIPWILEFVTFNWQWNNGPQAYLEVAIKIIIGLQGFILFCAIAFDFKAVKSWCGRLREADSKLFKTHRTYNVSDQGIQRHQTELTGDTPLSSGVSFKRLKSKVHSAAR